MHTQARALDTVQTPTQHVDDSQVERANSCAGSQHTFSNRSRTRDAPTPTKSSTNSDAAHEKNGTPASPAMALASSVLPVPVA